MADIYRIMKTTLDDIADAIRAKTGGSSAMTPAEMVAAIGDIPSGTALPLFIKYEAITVTSDRITVGTGGNAKAFSDEFLPPLAASQIGYPIILVLIENTSNSDYAGQCMVRLSGVANDALVTMRYGVRKNLANIDVSSTTVSFYVGAGSIVHRYVFVREDPTS